MRALFAGLLASVTLAIVHLAVWRLKRPRAQYASLGALGLAVLVAALACFQVVRSSGTWLARIAPSTPLDLANFLWIYLAFVPSYVTTFSAVQADSPTMTLLLLVEQAGAQGLRREDILERVDDAMLILPRLDDLVTSGLARRNGGHYVIAPRGARLAAVHILYRRLLGMEKGG